uniref:Uncharacterized protein n=1 Tax=Arundo donax TaxID=35708 RepID=A0A0A8Z4F0_ARUDO
MGLIMRVYVFFLTIQQLFQEKIVYLPLNNSAIEKVLTPPMTSHFQNLFTSCNQCHLLV